MTGTIGDQLCPQTDNNAKQARTVLGRCLLAMVLYSHFRSGTFACPPLCVATALFLGATAGGNPRAITHVHRFNSARVRASACASFHATHEKPRSLPAQEQHPGTRTFPAFFNIRAQQAEAAMNPGSVNLEGLGRTEPCSCCIAWRGDLAGPHSHTGDYIEHYGADSVNLWARQIRT